MKFHFLRNARKIGPRALNGVTFVTRKHMSPQGPIFYRQVSNNLLCNSIIDDTVCKCELVFSVDDIIEKVPVLSV